MMKTIPEAPSILAPLSPDATYRVKFQGIDRSRYGFYFSGVFSCKEMGNGHIQFFSPAYLNHWGSLTNLIVTSSLVWPTSTQKARLDADTLVMRAPASFIRINQLGDRDWSHWTQRRPGQTIGLLTCTGDISRPRSDIILVDTGSVHTQEDKGRRLEASAMAAFFSTRSSATSTVENVSYPLSGHR